MNFNQKNKTLSLGYSPCPNDTYIFFAIAQKKINLGDLGFTIFLHDVETLNQAAQQKRYDISKLSFAAIGHLQDTYELLNAGAALGRGCGPLIVARKDFDLKHLSKARIAVPGLWTTAFLLLSLFMKDSPKVVSMPFERIMPLIQNGEYDVGIIIHEGRFTYQKYGLKCLMDLGEWWEAETSLPIPLGGIAIRREIPEEIAHQVEIIIRQSIQYAAQHPHAADEYIKAHSQEMSDGVIRQHIELYVNDFSIDLKEEGNAAIEKLFSMAMEKGIIT